MVQRFPITLTQLTYFVECAKTLNMTAASQNLHIAQSAISTAMTQLERALGTTLFIRERAKGLVLTPAGEGLLRDTHQVFETLSNTLENVRQDQQEIRGHLTIACFSTLAPFILPQLLSRMRQRYPELTVEVLEGDHAHNLSALRGGRAELAINYSLIEAEGVERTIVGEARPYLVLPHAHPLAAKRSVALAELADEPFVLLDLPSSTNYFLGILQHAGITPKLKYRSSSYETVRAMVASGLGYSILNQRPRIDATYSGDSTAARDILDPVPGLHITLSRLRQVAETGRARAVAEMIREVVREAHPGTAR